MVRAVLSINPAANHSNKGTTLLINDLSGAFRTRRKEHNERAAAQQETRGRFSLAEGHVESIGRLIATPLRPKFGVSNYPCDLLPLK